MTKESCGVKGSRVLNLGEDEWTGMVMSVCVIYGLRNRNKGGADVSPDSFLASSSVNSGCGPEHLAWGAHCNFSLLKLLKRWL